MADQSDTGGDPHLDSVMRERRQLINLSYRLLGSLADAEDAVQEAYTRWYAMSRAQQEAIESPAAWLTTVATRICLNHLRSARVRREQYVGEWIPEPVPDQTEWLDGHNAGTVDPADRITLDESVNMAFMVVLDSMTPAERVALILHDVFRYSFGEVAEMVGRTPAACRQLASSARRRVSAALYPIEGADPIAHYYVELAGRMPSNMTILERTVNGQPGLVVQQDDGVTVTVFAFDLADDRIKHIWAVRNPDKLRPWTAG